MPRDGHTSRFRRRASSGTLRAMTKFRSRAKGAWLVTGAASGFGRCYASRLAAMGEEVVLWDRNGAGVADAQVAIGAQAVHVEAVDVSSAEDVRRAVDATSARARVRHVVHSAGILRVGPAVSMSASDYAQMIAVNLLGTIHVATAWAPELGRAEGGRATLLLVASVAGLRGYPELAGYSASKHGVVGFARALRDELAGGPIDVQVLCPPPGDTPMVRDLERLPPIYKLSRLYSAEEIVASSMGQIERGGFLQLVDATSRATHLATALVPGLVDRIVQRASRS